MDIKNIKKKATDKIDWIPTNRIFSQKGEKEYMERKITMPLGDALASDYYNKGLSVKELSRRYGISEKRVTELIRDTTGMSIS